MIESFKEVKTQCRCGKRITMHPDSEPPFVLHALPPCPQFEQLEVTAYLKWVRTGALPR